MSTRIVFENNFSLRVVEILFPEGFVLATNADLQELKTAWTANLKSWHSPYTCLFDARQFSLDPAMEKPFAQLIVFFQNFFLRKIVGFCNPDQTPPALLPFPVLLGYQEAAASVGLARQAAPNASRDTLRSQILVDNDFNAHVMEIQFAVDVEFKTAADILILKEKIKTLLRQWHTPYSVLIHCLHCSFAPETHAEFAHLERFLKGFFCKKIIGYSPKMPKETYPFSTYRSRHVAVAELEHSGIQSGAKPHCKSSFSKG